MKNNLVCFIIIFMFSQKIMAYSDSLIIDYDVSIEIEDSGCIHLTEIIKLNVPKNYTSHDLYREIPLYYKDSIGKKTFTNLKIQSLTRDDKKVKYYYKIRDNMLRLYFGKKDKIIATGIHVFVIKYKLENLINYSQEYDKLELNFLNKKWGGDIENLSVVFLTPLNIQPIQILGIIGNNKVMKIDRDVDEHPVLEFSENLKAGDDIFLKVLLPKNVVTEPSKIHKFTKKITDYVDVCFGLFVLCLTALMFYNSRNNMNIIELANFALIPTVILSISFLFMLKYKYILGCREVIMVSLLFLLSFGVFAKKCKKSKEKDYYISSMVILFIFDCYFFCKLSLFASIILLIILLYNVYICKKNYGDNYEIIDSKFKI